MSIGCINDRTVESDWVMHLSLTIFFSFWRLVVEQLYGAYSTPGCHSWKHWSIYLMRNAWISVAKPYNLLLPLSSDAMRLGKQPLACQKQNDSPLLYLQLRVGGGWGILRSRSPALTCSTCGYRVDPVILSGWWRVPWSRSVTQTPLNFWTP